MAHRPHIPDPVYEKADELCDERDFTSIGEAIRFMAQEGDFDV